jgi:DNA-binding response OmpR family regulator
VLSRTLTGLGHEPVAQAADAASAMQLARTVRAQVVLLDWPGSAEANADAAAFLRAFRRFDRRCRVIAMSTRQDPKWAADALALGASDCLPKPFSPQQLAARLAAPGGRSAA